MAAFLQEITRVPTINPPGEFYADFVELCARHYEQVRANTAVFARNASMRRII